MGCNGVSSTVPVASTNVQLEQMMDQIEGANLICPIDQLVLKEPRKLPCNHVFCKFCIERWLHSKGTCPVCRKDVKTEDAKPACDIAAKISGLIVKCNLGECKWTGKLADYHKKHLAEDCSFAEVDCPYGCDKKVERRGLEAHYQVCEFRDPEKVKQARRELESLRRDNDALRAVVQRQNEALVSHKAKQFETTVSSALIRDFMRESSGNLVKYAKLAQAAKQFDDMRLIMRELAGRCEPLTAETQVLFSEAYKQCVGSLRTAHRTLLRDEKPGQESEAKRQMRWELKSKMATEINFICDEVLATADNYASKRKLGLRDRLFFAKQRADYLRFKAECLVGKARTEMGKEAQEVYEKAIEEAKAAIYQPDPLKIGLILNYTVLLYEISEDKAKALDVSRNTIDEETGKFSFCHTQNRESDVVMILQLMRENVLRWMTQ